MANNLSRNSGVGEVTGLLEWHAASHANVTRHFNLVSNTQ